jgi:acetyl esterase/lipase
VALPIRQQVRSQRHGGDDHAVPARPGKASGAAVVVAPGGGFRTLSMENEGWNVARALAERGVAAFVLKYRLNQTPADMPGFERSMKEMFSSTRAPAPCFAS